MEFYSRVLYWWNWCKIVSFLMLISFLRRWNAKKNMTTHFGTIIEMKITWKWWLERWINEETLVDNANFTFLFINYELGLCVCSADWYSLERKFYKFWLCESDLNKLNGFRVFLDGIFHYLIFVRKQLSYSYIVSDLNRTFLLHRFYMHYFSIFVFNG